MKQPIEPKKPEKPAEPLRYNQVQISNVARVSVNRDAGIAVFEEELEQLTKTLLPSIVFDKNKIFLWTDDYYNAELYYKSNETVSQLNESYELQISLYKKDIKRYDEQIEQYTTKYEKFKKDLEKYYQFHTTKIIS